MVICVAAVIYPCQCESVYLYYIRTHQVKEWEEVVMGHSLSCRV